MKTYIFILALSANYLIVDYFCYVPSSNINMFRGLLLFSVSLQRYALHWSSIIKLARAEVVAEILIHDINSTTTAGTSYIYSNTSIENFKISTWNIKQFDFSGEQSKLIRSDKLSLQLVRCGIMCFHAHTHTHGWTSPYPYKIILYNFQRQDRSYCNCGRLYFHQ